MYFVEEFDTEWRVIAAENNKTVGAVPYHAVLIVNRRHPLDPTEIETFAVEARAASMREIVAHAVGIIPYPVLLNDVDIQAIANAKENWTSQKTQEVE